MKNLKKWLVLLAALFVLTGIMSCEMFEEGDDSLAVIGEWETADYTDPSKMVTILEISESECIFHMGTETYTGKIVSYSNSEWNNNESGEGTYGYFVIQYEDNPSWKTTVDITDKFMVFRWKNLLTTNGTTTIDYSEGTDAVYNGYQGTYFDTADTATTGATEDEGFFNYFSQVTKKDS